MSVKIEQLQLLVQNDYDAMVIRKNNEGYKVNVRKHGDDLPTAKLIRNHEEFFNGMNDDEKVEQVITWFLVPNKINYISRNIHIPHRSAKYVCVRGDKELYFDLPLYLEQKVISKLKEKYYQDRLKEIKNNSDITYYNFKLDNASCYSIIEDENSTKQMNFCLLSHKKSSSRDKYLDEDEKLFLREFLYNKFKEVDCEATIENKHLYGDELAKYINLGYYVNCGNVIISIDNKELLPEVAAAVHNYNREREHKKTKQLKLEEF